MFEFIFYALELLSQEKLKRERFIKYQAPEVRNKDFQLIVSLQGHSKLATVSILITILISRNDRHFTDIREKCRKLIQAQQIGPRTANITKL